MTLFGPTEEPTPRVEGPVAKVAIEQSLDRSLDYAIPPALVHSLQVGQRVKVPLGRGNKPTFGYVVALQEGSDHPKIKSVLAIADERVLVTRPLMELSRWMSRYYCTPLGTVLESVIPSAVKKRVGLEYTQQVRLIRPRGEIQELLEKTKARKRRAILARLLQTEEGAAIELIRLAEEAGATPATVRKLVRLGLISITAEADYLWTNTPGPAEAEKPEIPELNEDQQKVFDDLLPRLSAGFSVNLLLGVTGSGKTEIYLRCIEEVVRRGKQAIVMVPEIALTPQTVRRFTVRFARVAVLHSGLGASQRHRYWQQIWNGQADVVVGARSSVFAPLPRLGMIVIDEEHEASYKQDSAPRYHGRDVGIKRAQLEGVPILLGSATPSLESYWRAGGGKEAAGAKTDPPGEVAPAGPVRHHLLSLPRRVRGLAMPAIEVVDMRQEARMRRGIHMLSQRLEHLLRVTLEQGHQAILLLNRRGYSNFVYCASCGEVINCKYCDKTMTYHRSVGAHAGSAKTSEGIHTGQLHCHYCLAVNPLPEKCPACGKTLSLFGLGTQRVEEELAKKFPELKYARVDSDTMHNSRDYEALLGRFARKEISVMLGTQMIAKGLDYPNVTLVGVISGDTALALPDFRAAERTFQLITQVAGRAGRGDFAGRVVLQTFQPEDPTIRAAIRQDFTGFATAELKGRREVGLPPFVRMVRVVLRHEEVEPLQEKAQKVALAITQAMAAENGLVKLKGPMPCAITRIAGYNRFQILLFSPSGAALQRILATVRKTGGFSTSDRIAVDVDPVSLL